MNDTADKEGILTVKYAGMTAEEAAQPSTEEEVKYCVACGEKNPIKVKFCGECASTLFAPTREEALALRMDSYLKEIEVKYETGKQFFADGKYPEAYALFYAAAEAGHIDAQNCLGYLLERGLGVKKDVAEAARWYLKAAVKGSEKALNNLGNCYFYGRGVEKSREEAIDFYEKSSSQEHLPAAYNLGQFYFLYDGDKRYEEAARWYRQAANGGHDSAMNALGVLFSSGKGVVKDEEEAFRWFEKAAKAGNPAGQNNLGECYYAGEGVKKDWGSAVKWYQKAALQGYARAQFNLGWCYYFGQGVKKNRKAAMEQIRKAAEGDDPSAIEFLKKRKG